MIVVPDAADMAITQAFGKIWKRKKSYLRPICHEEHDHVKELPVASQEIFCLAKPRRILENIRTCQYGGQA